MVAIFKMSAKLATLGLLKIKVFSNKGYGVIIFIHGVSNKILSGNSNYIVDVVMWPKFGNSNISMREFIMTKQQFYKDLTRKKKICEGRTWFKFNNLGLEPGMSLKFYTSVTKEIKLNVKSFGDVKVPIFIEVTGINWVVGWGVGWVQRCLLPILNRIKAIISIFRVLTYLLNYPYIHLSSL